MGLSGFPFFIRAPIRYPEFRKPHMAGMYVCVHNVTLSDEIGNCGAASEITAQKDEA